MIRSVVYRTHSVMDQKISASLESRPPNRQEMKILDLLKLQSVVELQCNKTECEICLHSNSQRQTDC